MRALFITVVFVAILTLGCAPVERDAPAREATPTPDETISTMDFESGEATQPTAEPEEPQAESTPGAD